MTQEKSHPEVDWLFHKLRHTSAFDYESPSLEATNNEETEKRTKSVILLLSKPRTLTSESKKAES